MALGNNLKKKKLIPDSPDKPKSEKISVTKKTAKKPSSPAKKTQVKKVKPSSPKKPKVETKAAKSDNKKLKSEKPASIEDQVVAPKATPPIEIKEDIIAEEITAVVDVETTMTKEVKYESANPNHDQIISAYSIYIAQELNDRKNTLRKRYIKEISELQGKPIQFILITIGNEKYALDIDCVKEVVPIPTVSKTPNTPEHIKGVVNVRGSTYVAFDLASKFRIIGQEVPRYLLVLSNKELKSGIPLSNLPVTFKTNGDQITNSLQIIENALLDASYIKGIVKNEEELIYYLDIVELLKNDKAIVIPDNLIEEK